MYANVRGLGDVLVRTGVIEELGVFEDFVRGFTRGKSLFDFVDVGAGKDRADKKVEVAVADLDLDVIHLALTNLCRIVQHVLTGHALPPRPVRLLA
jgi:hypothetical protein